MNYLLTGEGPLEKDRQIAEIKEQVLSSPESEKFDLDNLDSHKLSPSDLKKALIALPAVSPQRLLILRSIDKLTPHNKELLEEHLESGADHVVLILETEKPVKKNAFYARIARFFKTISFGERAQTSVFDMTKAMTSPDATKALKILKELLSEGNHPLQIMGALVWFWGKTRNRLSGDRFKKGLLFLQEADLNIKRSRMDPENAVELVVVKLCSLLVC